MAGYDDGRVLVFDTASGRSLPALPSVDSDAAGVVRLPPASPSARLAALEPARLGRQPDWTGWEARNTAALAFRPDGALVVGSEVGQLRIVDPATGRVIRRLTGAPPLTSNNRLLLSPDGSVLVSTGWRGVVRWDLARGRPAWVSPLPEDSCGSVGLLPEQGLVLCGGRYGRVESLFLADGRRSPARFDMQHGEVSDLLVTADGTTLAQLSRSRPVVARWALDGTGPVTRSRPVAGLPLGYDASGGLLLTSGPDLVDRTYGPFPVLRVVDARSGALVRRISGYARAWWSARPGHLLAWDDSGTGYLVDARSGRRTLTLQGGFGGPADGAAAAADGRVLLAWSQDSGLGVRPVWEAWDLRTGEILGAGEMPGQVQLGGTTTADGAIGVWSGAGTVTTFRTATRDTIARRDQVVAAAVSPTGLVAASATDGRLAFLRAPSLRGAGRSVSGNPGTMHQLAFSSDGRVLAARGGDGTLRIIDVPARTQLGEPIEVGVGADRRIALRPDGRELAMSTGSGLSFWDLRVSRWRTEACRLAGRNLTRGEWSSYLSATGEYRRTCPA